MNLTKIVSDILALYNVEGEGKRDAIESYMHSHFDRSDQGVKVLKELISIFESAGKCDSHEQDDGEQDIFKLLLGREISHSGFSNQEMMDRLAACLDTIFSSLNEIIAAINNPLTEVGDATIRFVIGEHLIEGNDLNQLKDQIFKIKNAYLATQDSFRSASHSITKRLLDELNPAVIMDNVQSRLKLECFKKADGFKEFEMRYAKCLKWFESGRFNQDLLNAFEKEYANKVSEKEKGN